ncbi:unnamed protein product [Penicillium roqueforti FM164]|uniref:Uncharacterized protein n=1 Tax=Penicillium roqueforti (strain FM164) TaxID=1365484 RepID=W6R8B4_PENRF|nr:unnamed protein product [Penicillium roqueforti FM164]
MMSEALEVPTSARAEMASEAQIQIATRMDARNTFSVYS